MALFALDHNYPAPIIEQAKPYLSGVELVFIGDIDPRLPEFDDWELLLALTSLLAPHLASPRSGDSRAAPAEAITQISSSRSSPRRPGSTPSTFARKQCRRRPFFSGIPLCHSHLIE